MNTSAENTALSDLGDHIGAMMADYVLASDIAFGELMLTVGPTGIEKMLKFLRDDSQCRFEIMVDLCGVDYPARDPRFEVVYNLLSITNNQRIRVKVPVADGEAVPSIVGIHNSAGWFEREAWDLYGILFDGNPDLRRILTDYGFDGHPLRKDFPLSGFVELRYDDEQKRVVYEPVKLPQEFRQFDFMSPWEGAKYVLPGDEKADEPAGGEST